MGILLDALTWALILGGSFFAVVGGLGIIRMPDLYTRLHAAGVTDTMGAGLVLVGLMLYAGLSLVTVKLGMILVLLWLTSPVSTYALARAALNAGLEPYRSGEGDF